MGDNLGFLLHCINEIKCKNGRNFKWRSRRKDKVWCQHFSNGSTGFPEKDIISINVDHNLPNLHWSHCKKRNFNQLHLCKKYYNTHSFTHHFHLKMKPSHKTSKLSRLTVIVSGAASALTDGMVHVLIAVRWMPRYVEGMSCDHALSLLQNCTCWEHTRRQ